tara:strand:+ start:914 stop:1072 length:159 start_codon:yes stop_codon:yes gene_type:complete
MDYINAKDYDNFFDNNISSAFECAMASRTDEMSESDFKNLVMFFLYYKCQTT